MNPIDDILSRAAAASKCIVLPEGEDPRIQEGAVMASHLGTARTVLLGNVARIEEGLAAFDPNPGLIQIIDPSQSDRLDTYAAAFYELRKHKGVDAGRARSAMADPIAFAAMMVRQEDADGCVGGAVATTADTVRAALQIIGPAPGVGTVSSFFVMLLPPERHGDRGALIFSDCGLVVEPSAEQLADIACAAADSYAAILGGTPRVAMLSFSTGGSAKHERVDRVIQATARAKALRPDLTIDGDIQFDAAFVPSVAAVKAKNSPLKGNANVLIFPNLDAGNIGYKIAQRVGGAEAVGPILQGLAKPANDLSRGCVAKDVHLAIAVTVLQAASMRE